MQRMAFLLLAGVAMTAGCSTAAQPPPFKPLADIKLLMNAVIDPAADVVWGSAGQIITATGTQDLRPTTEEGWATVRNSAIGLAEAGNLLMITPRVMAGDDWMKMAQAMVDTGAAAAKAAEAKDADQLFQAGADIYSVCTNCHSKYSPEIARSIE